MCKYLSKCIGWGQVVWDALDNWRSLASERGNRFQLRSTELYSFMFFIRKWGFMDLQHSTLLFVLCDTCEGWVKCLLVDPNRSFEAPPLLLRCLSSSCGFRPRDLWSVAHGCYPSPHRRYYFLTDVTTPSGSVRWQRSPWPLWPNLQLTLV